MKSVLSNNWPMLIGLFCMSAAFTGCESMVGKGVATQAIDDAYKEGGQRFDSRQQAVAAMDDPGEPLRDPESAASASPSAPDALSPDKPELFPGSGRLVKPNRHSQAASAKGDITLNFENTDIREVSKVILGDLLGLNYILAPNVKGSATLQTGRPISKDLLLSTLETLLRMNGAALVKQDGLYQVLAVTNAIQGVLTPQLGDMNQPLPDGYSVRIVPLRYVSVAEMAKILEPLAPKGSVIRADTLRNLLILAGTSPEMSSLIETIDVFDVDWMKGLSVGFFPLSNAAVADVSKDLEGLFGDGKDGPLAGLLRFFPIKSANGLLVVTPQKRYLEEAGTWIERFDRFGGNSSEEHLYVYRVKNGEAEELAGILNDLFSKSSASSKSRTPAQVAPGRTATTVKSKTNAKTAGKPATRTTSTSKNGSNTAGGKLVGEVQIVADGRNNSLLIMASARDYRKILSALEQLDVMPLQVLIEATIVEVALTDELQFGVQWFFQMNHGDHNSLVDLDGTLDSATGGGLSKLFPGFNWRFVTKAGDVRAVLSAFAGEGLVRVLSSPSVMVLDNQSARIQVGDQVPVATSQQQSTDSSANIVNNIEYRDTGVVLEVKPRVNPGGLVTMEVLQEVSTAKESDTSALDSPTISTRKITSTVAVQNDQTVVLGGLIRDETSNTKGGVPGLYNLPVVGWLFGQDKRDALRTELVIILTPTVISGATDIRDVTEDFRSRLKGLEGKF